MHTIDDYHCPHIFCANLETVLRVFGVWPAVGAGEYLPDEHLFLANSSPIAASKSVLSYYF